MLTAPPRIRLLKGGDTPVPPDDDWDVRKPQCPEQFHACLHAFCHISVSPRVITDCHEHDLSPDQEGVGKPLEAEFFMYSGLILKKTITL